LKTKADKKRACLPVGRSTTPPRGFGVSGPPRALENDTDANLAKNSFFSDYSKNLDIANIT
jgi:hypothetical protein